MKMNGMIMIIFWNEWCEDWETFEESFTTENGDTVIAFGYDGYDG